MIEIVALHARISEGSPHDLRGVEALSERVAGALDAGRTPVLLATDCALALATLPALTDLLAGVTERLVGT